MRRKQALLLALFLAFGAVLPAAGQESEQEPAEPKGPRHAVVTFDGKIAALPSLAPSDFQVETEKEKLAPSKIYAPGELPTLLAVVMQENQPVEFGELLPVLREFILSQPANTYVGLFYLAGQQIDNPVPFNQDLQKVAAGLRGPKGERNLAPPTPYEPLTRIVKYMEGLPTARKEIVLFSEGSDIAAGGAAPSRNRFLRMAVRSSHQSGIPVWVVRVDAYEPERIAAGGPPKGAAREAPGGGGGPARQGGSGGGGVPVGEAGQLATASTRYDPTRGLALGGAGTGKQYLEYLAERTGAKIYKGEKMEDLRSALNEIQELMGKQLVLEFDAPGSIKKIKLERKVKDAKLIHPKT